MSDQIFHALTLLLLASLNLIAGMISQNLRNIGARIDRVENRVDLHTSDLTIHHRAGAAA